MSQRLRRGGVGEQEPQGERCNLAKKSSSAYLASKLVNEDHRGNGGFEKPCASISSDGRWGDLLCVGNLLADDVIDPDGKPQVWPLL